MFILLYLSFLDVSIFKSRIDPIYTFTATSGAKWGFLKSVTMYSLKAGLYSITASPSKIHSTPVSAVNVCFKRTDSKPGSKSSPTFSRVKIKLILNCVGCMCLCNLCYYTLKPCSKKIGINYRKSKIVIRMSDFGDSNADNAEYI